MNELGSQPYWMDEGYTVSATLSVLENGTTVLDSGKPYSCPIYCYTSAAIAQTFGDDASSYRILSALAGTALIAVVFFFARRLFGAYPALLAAAFTALSYYQIAWSRQARWYTLFELFFVLALFFFYQALYDEGRRHRTIYALLCAGATILAILSHGLGVLLIGVFAAWLFIDGVCIRKNTHATLVGLGALAASAVLLFTTPQGASLLSRIDPFFALPYYTGFYLAAYSLFLALALVALWYKRREKAVWFLVLAILAYLIPIGFLTEVVHYRYLLHLMPLLFMLAGVGLFEMLTRLKQLHARCIFGGLVAFLFFASGTLIATPQGFYFLEADDPELAPGLSYYAYTPQPDWNAAYAFIEENRAGDDIVVSTMPQFNKVFLREPGYWLKHDYYRAGEGDSFVEDDREYYANAVVVDDLEELEELAQEHDGFLVFDYMATDGRLSFETLNYIAEALTLAFHKRENEYSQVWVYRF